MSVRSVWLAAGSGSFGPLTQAILATQIPDQAAQQFGFVPSTAFWDAIVNAISSLEQGVIALQRG